jgi:ATP-binding cassette subfamily B protein
MSAHDVHQEESYYRRVDPRTWRRLWGYTRPYRPEVFWTAVFAATTAGADASFPLIHRALIDAAAGAAEHGESFSPWPFVALWMGATLVLAGSILGFIRLAGRLRTKIGHDIRRDGFANLQRLSFSYYDKRPVGWLMARMTSDCDRLANIMAWGVVDVVWCLFLMTGVAGAMLAMNLRLGLVCLAVLPVLAWVSVVFQRRILESARRTRKANSRLTAAFNEGILGVRTSKVFRREEQNLSDFRGLTGEMYSASVQNMVQSALYTPVILGLASVSIGFALALGGHAVLAGGITVGTLIAFLGYAALFFEPVMDLSRRFSELQMAQASAERVLSLIDEVPAVQDTDEVRARLAAAPAERPAGLAEDGLPDRVGTIRFEGVSFAYDDGKPVLEDFELEIGQGETIALVGTTGGGKSTIVGLLCRFYEPTAGRITLDGVDYRGRPLHWLQGKLGIVLQTPHLFSGAIGDNIRYGDLTADEAAVERAARLAGAHDFIAALPDGYATNVGEGGARLSVGQKQLVSFARAILADPEILVLDEATSSVDTETERRVQEGLAHVLEGRTSFVIAHRLSTIRAADRILVIEGGRIVEQGDHATLLARHGRYHELYTGQSLRETIHRKELYGDGDISPAPG